MPESIRLDRFFSSQNLASRKEFRALLKQGRVTVNQTVPKSADQKVCPGLDRICLDGKEIGYQKYIYLMLNKPPGVVSATNDRSQRTVLDLVPEALFRPGLFPAGRLDKDTTGFVLLTDDGDFVHRLLSPRQHIVKTYHAVLDGPIPEDMAARFREGVTLKDGFVCLPALLKPLSDGERPAVEIVLHEGKYHQIKRMAAACGRHVLALKRVKMGGLPLDPDLPEGECRELLHKEIVKLLETPKAE